VSAILNVIVIRVADLDASRRFYEAFGLQFSPERHGNGPEHLAARVAGAVFELYPCGAEPASSGIRLGFQVASVRAAVSAVEQVGGNVASLPKEGPWGLRAVVIDPDGNRVEITQ
jgi:predicted enzyme related to lactoylglutathione lyase